MESSILKKLEIDITPLIDHDTATFVWKGRRAPHLEGDFTGWEEGKSVKLVKSDLEVWTYQLSLPADAYIEYGFLNRNERMKDPLNPRLVSNGVGGYNNYFSMPEYKPTKLIRKDPKIPHGNIKEYSLPTNYTISGNHRKIHLYQPPVTESVPLVVVFDGQEYLQHGKLNIIIDNLIAQGRIHPVALAFVNNGGEKTRMVEYACSEATLIFLMKQVIPLAKKELNLLDINSNPGEYGVLGASMGGLMALYTGARLPNIFGKVLSQSGAFSLDSFDMVVYNLLEQCEVDPLKVWMDVGRFDLPGLLEANRRMQSLLVQRGHQLTYCEYNAGHNYPSWRNDIAGGLEVLYGKK